MRRHLSQSGPKLIHQRYSGQPGLSAVACSALQCKTVHHLSVVTSRGKFCVLVYLLALSSLSSPARQIQSQLSFSSGGERGVELPGGTVISSSVVYLFIFLLVRSAYHSIFHIAAQYPI